MSDGPVAAQIVVVMSALFGVAFLAAFFLQWNQVSIEIRSAEKLAKESKEKPKGLALLRWCFINPWIVAKEIWDETKGSRFLVPLGTLLCGIAYFTYRTYLT